MKAGKDNTQARGEAAESLAAAHLEAAGLRLLARNYRCRGGELDLVALAGRTLVFVEVRLRGSAAFGGAAESITAKKRRRVILAASHYLATHPADAGRDCRFDCVLLARLERGAIEWIRDAFRLD